MPELLNVTQIDTDCDPLFEVVWVVCEYFIDLISRLLHFYSDSLFHLDSLFMCLTPANRGASYQLGDLFCVGSSRGLLLALTCDFRYELTDFSFKLDLGCSHFLSFNLDLRARLVGKIGDRFADLIVVGATLLVDLIAHSVHVHAFVDVAETGSQLVDLLLVLYPLPLAER